MTLFAIYHDFDYYQLFCDPLEYMDYFPDESDPEAVFNFGKRNISLSSFWPNTVTEFYDCGEKRKKPDICGWMDDGIALSPKAKILAGGFLQPYGEFLPTQVDGEEWHIFHCLKMKTPISEDAKSISFSASEAGGSPIFKAETSHRFGLFCTDRFKQLVTEYELKGIVFAEMIPDIATNVEKTLEIQG